MFKSSSSRPHANGRRTGGWLALFACWLACLLLQGQALAGPAPEAIATVTPAPVQYRVINLVPGTTTQFPAINASGQVAMSVADGDRFQSWFFDGRRLHAVAQPGWPDTDVTGLNDLGQLSGFSHAGYDAQHAFRWSLAGGFAQIGLDGESSHASAINRDGVVVFDAAGALDPPRALRWTAAGGREELGALDRWGSVPVALNDAGLVTGFSNNASIDPHAFAWTRAGGIRDLGTLGGAGSYASGVDAAGQVAGYAAVAGAGANYHAFRWTAAGGMRDLGTLGGTDSFSLAVSKPGQIVGVYNLAGDVQRGFSWNAKSGMVDVGTLGGSGARPLGVNGVGQVAGSALTANGELHAFLWRAGQPMADLNARLVNAPAGLVLDTALALSDSGAIVASSNAGLVLLRPVGSEMHPAPVVGPIALPALAKAGGAVAVRVAFNDSDSTDLHHVDWQWGDLSMETGLVTEKAGAGSAHGVHVYREAGIYTVIARVTDRAGNTTTVKRELVVADPAGSATLGRGRIDSPQGALHADPAHGGAATFSITAPASGKPAGLHFAAGKAVFVSTSMAGAMAAAPGAHHYEGTGQFNGKAGYQYSLTVVGAAPTGRDGGQIGLRIWHTDPVSHATVIDYDNQRSGRGSAKVTDGAIAAAP